MSYAAIAVAVGGVMFLLAVWLPALREVAGAGDPWRLASESFARGSDGSAASRSPRARSPRSSD